MNVNVRRKERQHLARELIARHSDLAQPRQPRQRGDTRVGHSGNSTQLDFLERLHTAEDRQAAIGDPVITGEILPKFRKPRDVFRRAIGRLPTVHQYQRIHPIALADEPITFIGNVHRHELSQRWKAWERSQRGVAHVLAAHRQTAQHGHARHRREAAIGQAVAATTPDVFDRSRRARTRPSPSLAAES